MVVSHIKPTEGQGKNGWTQCIAGHDEASAARRVQRGVDALQAIEASGAAHALLPFHLARSPAPSGFPARHDFRENPLQCSARR